MGMKYADLGGIKTNSKYMTRHIVPFGFSPNGDVDIYNDIFRRLQKVESKNFVLRNNVKRNDTDIYDYMFQLYDNTGSNSERSIGSIWKYQDIKKEMEGQYYKYIPEIGRTLYVRISEAGMYLLKTGIGLFWYELRHYQSLELMEQIECIEQILQIVQAPDECEEKTIDKLLKKLKKTEEALNVKAFEEWNCVKKDVVEISVENEKENENIKVRIAEKIENSSQIKKFAQNVIKEINHLDYTAPDFEYKKELVLEQIRKRQQECMNKLLLNKEQANATDLKTILDLQNVMKELARPHYMLQYCEMKDEPHKMCLLGKWVDDVLKELGCDTLEYFPSRIPSMEESTYDLDKASALEVALINYENMGNILVPDKSILFSYVAIDESILKVSKKEVLKTTAYYMAMGYNGRYDQDLRSDDYEVYPYANKARYARKEGYAECLAFSSQKDQGENNSKFFTQLYKHTFRNDYFHIYMHLLQQSYSIFSMTKELTTVLPVSNTILNDGNKEVSDKLVDVIIKINLFITKNTKMSVSHVEKQNDFYNYIEKEMHIQEDLMALYGGVEKLEEMLRRQETRKEEEKSERMQAAFSTLTVITILTLVKDIIDTVGVFVAEIPDEVKYFSFVVVFILFTLASISARHEIMKFLGLEKKRVLLRERKVNRKE